MVSYLIHYNSLLQIATDIIANAKTILLQNASRFLSQNATVTTN